MGRADHPNAKAGTLPEALDAMRERGLLSGWRQIAEDAVSLQPPYEPHQIAREASILLPGQWYPTPMGCTWLCGRRRCWLIEADYVHLVEQARAAASRLGVVGGWSVGSVANALLKWAVEPQMRERSAERLRSDVDYAYHDCFPGEIGSAWLFDARACYFTLLCRLPSVRLSVLDSGILWHAMTGAERSRWDTMLGEVGGIKLLRNSLVGCMVGGVDEIVFYHQGIPKQLKRSGGPLRAAGLLIVRSAYELCCEAASEVDSLYSMTDCVVSPSASPPRAWAKVGLEVRLQAAGDAEIYGRGIYRVGEHSTHWYRLGSRLQLPVPRRPLPYVRYAPKWLPG